MWYPATIAAPSDEPVTLANARLQCRIGVADTSFDTELTRLITVARGHVESVCGVRFAARTGATMLCDSFADLARLPEAPVTSITSISYVDTAGDDQTLSTDVYELRSDELDVAVVLKYGQAWPSIRPGSRITVTAVLGYASAPEAVQHAMLMFIADAFHQRENAVIEDWTVVDALLINHRRNA